MDKFVNTEDVRMPNSALKRGRGTRSIEVDDELMEDIRELIRGGARTVMLNIFADLHPADIADILEHLTPGDRLVLFELLDARVSSEVLLELHPEVRQSLLEGLSSQRLTSIVSQLDSDDATDLVAELPEEVARKVLEAIPKEDSEEVQDLLRYPDDTAGGIMAREFIAVNRKATIKRALREVRKMAKQGGEVYNVYVVDDDGRICGYLPLQNLVIHSPNRKIYKVMDPDVISVKADVDQEAVAEIFKKYDILSLPVVDGDNHVIGRITVDDVVDVIVEENTEDIQKMAGLAGAETAGSTIFQVSRIRLPWLLLAFAGELVSVFVLQNFQASIEKIVAAAFFIPIVMAMGGNAGIQSSALVVRGLATGEIWLGRTRKRVLKEMGVALMNGLILSSLIFAISSIWFNDALFGMTVGISLLVVVANATVVGALVPLGLAKLRIDPAIATGPFITTSNDVVGLLIYFGCMTFIYLR
ncbi:MAG: magnesium transporter [Bacteroidota bacterium]